MVLRTEDIDYRDGQLNLRGVLAYDETVHGKRPGIVVVHEAWGLGAHAIERAKMLAELGYVALAADMYGDRRQAADLPAAMELIGDLRTDPATAEDEDLHGLLIIGTGLRRRPRHDRCA